MRFSRGKLVFLFLTVLLSSTQAQNNTSVHSDLPKEKYNSSKLTTESDFMIVGLPDTQYYTEDDEHNEMFDAQTKWIVQNYLDSNIVFVAHYGDVVQHDDEIEDEWIRADTVMAKLENVPGLPEGIPYGVDVGNHDQDSWGDPNSDTYFYNQYFGSSRFQGRSYYGGHFGDDNDDHYNLFEVGSLKFIVVFLEFNVFEGDGNPLGWADDLLSEYSDRLAIVVCHRLLVGDDGTNVDFTDDGQAVFDALENNPNLFLMLCGHSTAEGRRVDQNSAGKNVYTLLSDYQGQNSGDGWMRLMKFVPSENKIYVMTFSPSRNNGEGDWRTGSNSRFTLLYPFDEPAPVELVDFTGKFDGSDVKLNWKTATEIQNFGFEIERSLDNANWRKIGFIEGNGNSNIPHYYKFNDSHLSSSEIYYYRLKQIDNNGSYTYSEVIKIDVILRKQFELEQNYPNPFNPTTKIRFDMPIKSNVTIKIYDVLGREVITLLENEIQPGIHTIIWNGKNGLGNYVPGGVYFYRLITENYSETKKMNLLK